MGDVKCIGGILICLFGYLICALFVISTPALAYEDSSTINFNVSGNIEEPSCDVAIKPSATIDLGTVSYQTLTGKAGSSGESTPVKLEFSNCSAGTSTVTLSFSGSYFDDTHTSIYKNNQNGSDGASGVGMQLLSQADNESLGPNDRYVYTFDDSAGSHTFNMIARMYSPYGKISAGIVGFTVTFDVTYK